MSKNVEALHQRPDLHFSICSSNKELFLKFEQILKKNGLIGIPDLQGNMHYIIDGRKGFPTAYQKVQNITLQLMEDKIEKQTAKVAHVEEISEHLITKYKFDQGLIGTRFMHYMIIHGLLDKSLLVSFSKYLYPMIGEIFSTSSEKVCYCTRYALRKLAKLEAEQRKQKVERDYLIPLNESYSNRTALNKLIAEGEILLQDSKMNYFYETPN